MHDPGVLFRLIGLVSDHFANRLIEVKPCEEQLCVILTGLLIHQGIKRITRGQGH